MEAVLGVGLVLITLYILARVALAYLFPKDSG